MNIKSFKISGEAKLGLAFAVFLVALPFMGLQEYWIHIVTVGFFYAVMASSWSFLVGYVGRISFAHAAMAGLGAYTSAMLSAWTDLPLLLTIPAGGLLAGFVGLAIGRICLKLHGAYLGLTTIAFGEILRITVTAEYAITKGSLGLKAPALFDTTSKLPNYYLFLFFMFAALLVMWLILRSRIGLFFASIREDEDAAISLGVKVVRYKILAFSLSSMIAGLAGAFYAHFIQLVTPSMMSLQEMGLILAMAVSGGFANIFYAAFGGLALEVLLEVLRDFGGWRMVLFAIVVIAVLRFAPNGVVGALMVCINKKAPLPHSSTADELENSDVKRKLTP